MSQRKHVQVIFKLNSNFKVVVKIIGQLLNTVKIIKICSDEVVLFVGSYFI